MTQPKRLKTRAEADMFIQRLIIPLIERVGLKVAVKHTDKEFTVIVKLPRG